jgi:hypothetical protein
MSDRQHQDKSAGAITCEVSVAIPTSFERACVVALCAARLCDVQNKAAGGQSASDHRDLFVELCCFRRPGDRIITVRVILPAKFRSLRLRDIMSTLLIGVITCKLNHGLRSRNKPMNRQKSARSASESLSARDATEQKGELCPCLHRQLTISEIWQKFWPWRDRDTRCGVGFALSRHDADFDMFFECRRMSGYPCSRLHNSRSSLLLLIYPKKALRGTIGYVHAAFRAQLLCIIASLRVE